MSSPLDEHEAYMRRTFQKIAEMQAETSKILDRIDKRLGRLDKRQDWKSTVDNFLRCRRDRNL